MESVINGEVSEEAADAKKAGGLSEESCESSGCNEKDGHLNNSTCDSSSKSPEKETSCDLTHNTSKNEGNIPQRNGSTDNSSIQTIANEDDSAHPVNTNSDTDSTPSPREKCVNDEIDKDQLESEAESSTGLLKQSFSASNEKLENSECAEQIHKVQPCSETVENDSNKDDVVDLSISPSNTKSNHCKEPVNSTDLITSNKEADTAGLSLDSTISSCSNPDDQSLKESNKTDKLDLGSKSNVNVCENSSEKMHENASNTFHKSVSITDAGHNSTTTYLESISPNFNSVMSEKGIRNESNPLEQLNEHLKSIGCIDNATPNCSVSKASAQEPDTNKNELPKTCQKDASSVDRSKQSDSFVFTEISKEETGFPEIFSDLVVIGKYISVKGDFTLRSTEALIESPSAVAPYLLKEPDTFPPRLNDSKYEQRDFFHSTAGEMLIGIGLSRVSEWYHRDMTRIKKRQMKREGKNPELEEDLKMHESFYNEARKANKIYSFTLKSCEKCGFVTESSIVMEGHLLVPHINQRREYQCNFCDAINRDPKAILEHMYRIHAKTGRIQPPVLFFECPFCTYESNSKVKLGNHLTKCQRFYDPHHNQAPPKDFEFPALTPKPITVAVVKSYEKTMSSMQRGRGRPKKIDTLAEQMSMNQYSPSINHSSLLSSHVPPYRPTSTSALSENMSSLTNQMMPSMQMPSMNLRSPQSNLGQLRTGFPPPMHLPSANRFYQVVNSSAPIMPMLGNNPLVTSTSQFPYGPSLVNTNSVSKKMSSPAPQFLNSIFGGSLRQQNSPKVPEVTITPLPKLHGPYPVPIAKPNSKPSSNSSSSSSSSSSNSLVVCEICDGYIKDLEQLRSHMQLIHKVKIHPKMLVSRPPLNCQKCQWRFFTDQGLERHLLGAHGLVTSNMQELANKSKDAGCCTICGRVFASKLVSHMNQVHKLTLKPAHLSYKCTVCSATFNLYRLFENHVYLVHSGAAKRPSDGSSNPSKKLKPGGDYGDSHVEGETKNHVEKKMADEGLTKCVECGNDFKKHAAQTDKCEKCLKCDVSQGTFSSKMS